MRPPLSACQPQPLPRQHRQRPTAKYRQQPHGGHPLVALMVLACRWAEPGIDAVLCMSISLSLLPQRQRQLSILVLCLLNTFAFCLQGLGEGGSSSGIAGLPSGSGGRGAGAGRGSKAGPSSSGQGQGRGSTVGAGGAGQVSQGAQLGLTEQEVDRLRELVTLLRARVADLEDEAEARLEAA